MDSRTLERIKKTWWECEGRHVTHKPPCTIDDYNDGVMLENGRWYAICRECDLIFELFPEDKPDLHTREEAMQEAERFIEAHRQSRHEP